MAQCALRGAVRRAGRAAAGAAAAALVLPLLGAAAASAAPANAPYDAAADGYSMYNVTLGTGAQAYWKAGYAGQGVGVALIDSGVSPVEGLTTSLGPTGAPAVPAGPNVVYGPDLSFDSQSPSLTDVDSFGHGTHMAGIIAGHDPGAGPGAGPGGYAGDSRDFLGMAPAAHIVSVKVADTYGDTDVTQLIAAIDWVVQHRDDPGMNIRVLNLSVGTEPAQPYQVDPLAYAAEQAWKHGIVVVVAAGNDGTGNRKGPGSGLEDPAYDPGLLAVGAADTDGTPGTTADDTVAGFSASQGAGATDGNRKPDLVAPGMHVASLRDPGSWIDANYARTGAVTDRLFRGSGTSQAAAVVSGAAALILSQHPDATPDQVKALLMQSADVLPRVAPADQGSGELDLGRALTRPLPPAPPPPRGPSTGAGSLQGSRGGNVLVDPDGAPLTGNVDIFGAPVDTAALARLEASAAAWSGGTFNGNQWTGTGWTTSALLGVTWSGHSWSSADWSGHSWSAVDWSGHSWSGHSWSGHSWSGHSWSGNTWSGNTWSGGSWSTGAWDAAGWR